MKSILCLLAAGLFTALSFASAEAISITADKDAYVQSGTSANTNFGSALVDQVKRQDNSIYTRKSYFGFDLSGLGPYPIASATLDFNFVDSGAGTTLAGTTYQFEVFGLINELFDSWSESTITWNNAPANRTNNGLSNMMVASLGTFSLTGKGLGLHSFTSPELIDFLNSDTNDMATFIIRRNTNQPSNSQNYVHAFASSENTSIAGPTLNVTPVPEPSTLLCVGAGLIGLGLLKRRRG
ncbi:protein of unknown function DUF1555 [Geobacter metallireducens RCH3]|uniref:PEP motif-containing protein, putative exosortase substrate n=1 Tax=Geobacter metallireducens (strain ATCC 53774 / DSM 7210 / GS-15) TaxID=269799 RepID=Q39SE7_GEOMG|nr:DNRLRE domain-containing protein [Geobacter metallireducens]ABB32827.1 PEP motif-containing protein, putative exosortase substrate [Geobacter metallireducens GS-15]EHP89040.1 protein of unknown function DUF1555 [Geobacter metallireducens RCH3]